MRERRDASAGGQPTPRRTKVAVLIGALDVGGAEQDLARNLPLLVDEFDLVVVEFSHAGALGGELADRGVRVVSRRPQRDVADGRRGLIGEGMRRASTLAWIVEVLRRERPDITHSVLPHSYVYQMIGTGLAGLRAKTVMSRRSLNFYADSQRLITVIERAVLHRRVDRVIANSSAIVDELVAEGVDPLKVRLIYNGIDLTSWDRALRQKSAARASLTLSSGDFMMLAVANLHTYKGHDDLLEACRLAADRLPEEWRLLIAGRDEEGNKSRLEALIESSGLTGNVRLLGPRDDVPLLLSAADVFVHPSHHEGLPNAVIEAMAASLPVVGTSVGGLSELVVPPGAGEPQTGWLVPPKDAHALAGALIAAGGDVDRRRQLGANARLRVERLFSLERSSRQYAEVYRELSPD